MSEKLTFYIDASLFTSRAEAHRVMQEVFAGYEYYGRNLDALYDVLTSLRQDAAITVNGLTASRVFIESYADRIREVFFDAATENPHISLTFTEDEEPFSMEKAIALKDIEVPENDPPVKFDTSTELALPIEAPESEA